MSSEPVWAISEPISMCDVPLDGDTDPTLWTIDDRLGAVAPSYSAIPHLAAMAVASRSKSR